MLPVRQTPRYQPAPGLLASIHMMSVLDFLRRRVAPQGQEVVFTVELEREADGRVIAEIPALPGVMVYGATQEEAIQRVAALAFRVLADRLESEEVQATPDATFHFHTRECLAGR